MRQWITGVILGSATLSGIYFVSLGKKDCTPCAQSVVPTPEVQVVKPQPTCPTCNVVDIVDLKRIRPEPDYRPTVSFDEPPLANPNGIVRTNFAVPSIREEAPPPQPVLEELPMPKTIINQDEPDPVIRTEQLLNDGAVLNKETWKRFWFNDMPSHLRTERSRELAPIPTLVK